MENKYVTPVACIRLQEKKSSFQKSPNNYLGKPGCVCLLQKFTNRYNLALD